MQRRPISWILDFTSKLPNDEEKVKCLRANDVEPIRMILRACFDPNIKWLLPEGEPPYQPSTTATENSLYQETRRIYLFIENGNNNLAQAKREKLFLDMIQGILPEDAKMMLSIKDKVMPYPGLTAKHVKLAFPDLWHEKD